MCLGVIGRVVRVVDAGEQVVEVQIGSALRRVNASLLDLDAVTPGTYVMINIGMAMEIVPEAEARAYLQLLAEIDQSYADEVAAER